MPNEGSFAHDEKAQELAFKILDHQRRADAELEALKKTRTPTIAVGAAMQHAKNQAIADKARDELIAHTGMEI